MIEGIDRYWGQPKDRAHESLDLLPHEWVSNLMIPKTLQRTRPGIPQDCDSSLSPTANVDDDSSTGKQQPSARVWLIHNQSGKVSWTGERLDRCLMVGGADVLNMKSSGRERLTEG